MMSQTSLESKLKALQCHFTWDLDLSRSKLFHLRYHLEDIGTEEGNSWLGHVYNLRGYVQYKLGFTEDAQSLFNKAAEAFCQTRRADEGPWLVVNYGNQAWLHHHLGEQAESQAYLAKVDALMNKYPSPSQDELHPEIYAEKAWTLMNFSADKRRMAADYFQRAIGMQPNMVEWKSSHVLLKAAGKADTGLDAKMLKEMRIAKEEDPENLYLAARYLQERAKKGERVAEEARELAQKILMNPVSSYSGFKVLLWVYRKHVSADEAIVLAEKALRHHPGVRFLKRCVAFSYRSKIYFGTDGPPDQGMIDKAIRVHEEVVLLYPEPSVKMHIDLANVYAKSNHNHNKATAEQKYQELIKSDLDPEDQQRVYNRYANHLYFVLNDSRGSVQYHMRVAEIPIQSSFRRESVKILEKIRDKRQHQMSREVEEFLENLPEPQ